MHDPAKNKQILELATEAVKAHPGIFIGQGRDPARIDRILDKLREVWERNPDLRLAQLVVKAAGANQPCPEVFYIEDDALLRGLDSF